MLDVEARTAQLPRRSAADSNGDVEAGYRPSTSEQSLHKLLRRNIDQRRLTNTLIHFRAETFWQTSLSCVSVVFLEDQTLDP